MVYRDIPVDLWFERNHGKHLCHVMVDTFDAANVTGMLDACRELMYAK